MISRSLLLKLTLNPIPPGNDVGEPMKKHTTFDEWKLKPEVRKLLYSTDLPLLISGAITDLRVSHGMTQAKLAKKVGMKQSAIARIEAGTFVPSFKTLARIAKAFDKTLVMKFEEI